VFNYIDRQFAEPRELYGWMCPSSNETIITERGEGKSCIHSWHIKEDIFSLEQKSEENKKPFSKRVYEVLGVNIKSHAKKSNYKGLAFS
jgi:hypothetical protein